MSYIRTDRFYVYGDGESIYCYSPHEESKYGIKLNWHDLWGTLDCFSTRSKTEMIEHLKVHLLEEQKTLFVQQEIVRQLKEAMGELELE